MHLIKITGLESLVHGSVFSHSEKSFIAAREGHRLSVVPVILQISSSDSVSELDHFGDGVPAVLADPATAAASVFVNHHVSRTENQIRDTLVSQQK